MITCPSCGKVYPNGTLICPSDGSEFVKPVMVDPELGSLAVQHVTLAPRIDLLEIGLEHVGTQDLDPAAPIRFNFELDRVGDPPLRIGRTDQTTSPPIIPEVDLTPHLGGHPYDLLVSRIQATIERDGDELKLRSMSDRIPTYHRPTGHPRAHPLSFSEYVTLKDYDSLYFGDPRGHHIALRIRILHP